MAELQRWAARGLLRDQLGSMWRELCSPPKQATRVALPRLPDKARTHSQEQIIYAGDGGEELWQSALIDFSFKMARVEI